MNNFVLEFEVSWLNYIHALSNQKLIRRQIFSSAKAVRNHGAMLLAREEGEESFTSCSICAKFKWITFVKPKTHFHGTLDYPLHAAQSSFDRKCNFTKTTRHIIISGSGGNRVIRSTFPVQLYNYLAAELEADGQTVRHGTGAWTPRLKEAKNLCLSLSFTIPVLLVRISSHIHLRCTQRH